ncbi:Prephenate dehydrogenase [Sistotremastrum niveocremeum HHB9708]|uniref:Prephenate dehydrogenase [NADP(+)] n=1 Tax=Sistotremastrum niveocremeum HHB9708 TaxID=1314777 RepID=A0A164NR58_9AGAM|nr:Prephenate dehydrogenase [Sistotremastrum niveocremeum HHB9708]
MIRPDVDPSAPEDEQPVIGLIGMGEMGKMYARLLDKAGWKKIHVCDLPSRFEELKEAYKDVKSVVVHRDGHGVSRVSDFIVYSVEAEFIGNVVKEYGPSTKVGAIVAGQTSVKAPEKIAFEKYLPDDVHIVSVHSLHGPTVSAIGQPLVLIQHRAPNSALNLVESILRPFKSRYVYLSYEEHDLVTANTQAVTHAAFLSMGTAWQCSSGYPWERGIYVGGIETVKVNIMLRIYANKWHVYAGLAILNPSAKVMIDQYAKSVTELFKLMLLGEGDELRRRVKEAGERVFGSRSGGKRKPILLEEGILDRFSLRPTTNGNGNGSTTNGTSKPPANSHLALLAMVDCWSALSINPYAHLLIAATPLFRLWIGVAEYLFSSPSSSPSSPSALDASLDASLSNNSFRSDDLEFVVAARGWSQCVSFGNFELYRERFEGTKKFFEGRFGEADKLGSEMIKYIMENSKEADA